MDWKLSKETGHRIVSNLSPDTQHGRTRHMVINIQDMEYGDYNSGIWFQVFMFMEHDRNKKLVFFNKRIYEAQQTTRATQ